MVTPTKLDDDGRPLPLFGFLNAHDAFRRDLPRFSAAARRLGRGELGPEAVDALVYHWSVYRTFLEEHHTYEDRAMFPMVADDEPALKPLIEDLAAQHDALHDLLPRITALLDQAAGRGAGTELASAFAALADLLEPHLAAEEEHLVPALRALIAAGTGGPPPRDEEAPPEQPVPDDYGVPFTVEHLDDELRPLVLPLFPSQPDPTEVDRWLAAYRARVARWTD